MAVGEPPLRQELLDLRIVQDSFSAKLVGRTGPCASAALSRTTVPSPTHVFCTCANIIGLTCLNATRCGVR